MKKILSILAVLAVIAVSITGCNNKPPFVRLAEAVDSLNVQYQQLHNTTENLISYDKFENRVNFHFSIPERIDEDSFGPIAEHIKQLFLIQFVTDNEFGVVTEAIDAHADVVVNLEGVDDTKYEILITTDEITEAYEALNPGVDGKLPEPTTPEQVELQQEQQQLTEGNVTVEAEQ